MQDWVGAGPEQGALIDRRQESLAPARRAALWRAFGLGHDHVRGQVLRLRPQAVRHPRADAGVGGEQAPIVNFVHRRSVHDAVRDERSDETDVIDMPGDVGEKLRDRQSALAVASELPRRAQDRVGAVRELAPDRAEALRQRLARVPVEHRLGIERVHRTGRADVEDEDDRVGRGTEVRPLGAERIRRGLGQSGPGQQVLQCERAESIGRAKQQVAPRSCAAGGCAARVGRRIHCGSARRARNRSARGIRSAESCRPERARPR